MLTRRGDLGVRGARSHWSATHSRRISHTREEGAVTCRPVDVVWGTHGAAVVSNAHTLSEVKKKNRTEYSVTSHRQHYTCPPFPTPRLREEGVCIFGLQARKRRNSGEPEKSVFVCWGPLQNRKLTRKLTCAIVPSILTAVIVTALRFCGPASASVQTLQSLQTVLVLLDDWKIEFTLGRL